VTPRLRTGKSLTFFYSVLTSGGQGAYEQKINVLNLGLKKLQVGTVAEATGGLWVHGMWLDGYPGHYLFL
jgi:hypothetical protein